MAAILIIEIIVLLALGVPIFLACRRWAEWVDRLSDRLWPFEKPKRFGRRSWAARSFVLEASAEDVVRRIDGLTEMACDSAASARPESARAGDAVSSQFLAMAPMLGKQTIETGIEIEWLDEQTAEMEARQYADWPATAEDDAQLPFKQRQRVVEQAVLYIEPMSGNRTRVSYELRVPDWIYVMAGAALVLAAWLTWGLWELQAVELFGSLARHYGLEPQWLLWNTAALWILLGWMVPHVARLIRLQSVSLLDNVIATFGETAPGDGPDAAPGE